MMDKPNNVNGFWDSYRNVVVEAGIPERNADCYVRWAEKFSKSIKNKTLRESRASDIDNFLSELSNQRGIESWQVRQAEDAILLLYKNFLNIDLVFKQSRTNRSQRLSRGQEQFRDQMLPATVLDKHYGVYLGRLKTAIRVRHYSIRTERAYIAWIRRFLSFHKDLSVQTMKADHIKMYLNYLAETRKIAASTQNQALNAIVFFFAEVLKRDPGGPNWAV
jgi:site-specific recombinase XerD